jgi:chromosome partitioning protein
VILTVAAYKGGVGKSTTAIHLAAALGRDASTLLIDRERVGGSFRWYEKGSDWSFDAVRGRDATAATVADYRKRGHVVVDTPAAPTPDELEAFATRSDLVIVPSTPDALALDLLIETVRDLRRVEAPFRVLLTAVPPFPSREGANARRVLSKAGIPLFQAELPRAAAFHHAALAGVLVEDTKVRGATRLGLKYHDVVNELKEANA